MRMGVVADDLTGSTDIGIMFAKAGYSTEIITFTPGDESLVEQVKASPAEVVILNTNARTFDPAKGYAVARLATQALHTAGCRQYFNKTCSVFRGPVGAYFDGMLDAFGAKFALVVLGFPKNGRVTKGGVHYVHGKRLEDSEFRNDPLHPMRQSNLVDILQGQVRGKVALLSPVDGLSPQELAAKIEDARLTCTYLILDVPDQAALETIAKATVDAQIFCGSSALAEELPRVWGPPKVAPVEERIPANPVKGTLVASGSLMPQTLQQLAWLERVGTRMVPFPAGAILDADQREAAIGSTVERLNQALNDGGDVAVFMPNKPETVTSIQEQAARMGLPAAEIGNVVSGILAEVVSRVVAQTGLTRLVVAGGETSAAVCSRLGMRRFRVWEEIEPGLPSCLALDGQPMLLVLKSGSFGSADFLQKAITVLHQAKSADPR